MADFRPNIYPIMYWGLLYGLAAGLLLFAVFLLSQFITLVWFPVFLAGVIWGGYRNYQKQKRTDGTAGAPQQPLQEFKEAAHDIVAATRDMMAEENDEAGQSNPPAAPPPPPPSPPQQPDARPPQHN
jgi:hypothetical protein